MRTLLLIGLISVFLFSSFLPAKPKPKLPKDFAWIPAGTLTLPAEDEDGRFVYDSQVTVSMEGFYMAKFEVSNGQYREFVSEVSAGLSREELVSILPDTSAWTKGLSYSEPLEKLYFRHPSFSNYPVVNVSYEGAVKYCEWLQKKIQAANPDFEISIKIPSLRQWVFAARGGRSQALFPWGNYYLRNKKGEPMCNFNVVNDGRIYRDRTTGKPAVSVPPSNARQTYTSTVNSFYPNDYGLYNICGNAAEMISEKGIGMGGSWNDYGGDVHILAKQNYIGPSPVIGFRPMILLKDR